MSLQQNERHRNSISRCILNEMRRFVWCVHHQENLNVKIHVLWWISNLKIWAVFGMIKSCISWEVNLPQTTFCLNCFVSLRLLSTCRRITPDVCFVISSLIMCRDLTEECIDQNDAVHATHKHHIPMNEDSRRFNVTWPKAICTFLCLQVHFLFLLLQKRSACYRYTVRRCVQSPAARNSILYR